MGGGAALPVVWEVCWERKRTAAVGVAVLMGRRKVGGRRVMGVRSSRTERRSALLMMADCLFFWLVGGERCVYFRRGRPRTAIAVVGYVTKNRAERALDDEVCLMVFGCGCTVRLEAR